MQSSLTAARRKAGRKKERRVTWGLPHPLPPTPNERPNACGIFEAGIFRSPGTTGTSAAVHRPREVGLLPWQSQPMLDAGGKHV